MKPLAMTEVTSRAANQPTTRMAAAGTRFGPQAMSAPRNSRPNPPWVSCNTQLTVSAQLAHQPRSFTEPCAKSWHFPSPSPVGVKSWQLAQV